MSLQFGDGVGLSYNDSLAALISLYATNADRPSAEVQKNVWHGASYIEEELDTAIIKMQTCSNSFKNTEECAPGPLFVYSFLAPCL